MNVLKTYRSLTAEQKRALREKRLEMNRPIGPLLEFLKPLGACDAMADKVRTKLGCTFGFALVITVVLLIFFSNLGWGPLTMVAMAAVIVALIAVGILWGWTRGIDVSNNFRQFALPVLTVLREDFDPESPVHISVDMSEATSAAKKTGEGAPYKAGAYYKIIDSTYVDPWMSLDAVLVDGTKLSWSVKDKIRERKKTKRNPRGKIKTKTKYKKKSDIEVSMGLRKKTYAMTATEGQMSGDEKRHSVKLEREVITASLDPIDPRALLDLVADVFRSAAPAKEGA